jgi:hypothetical protein
VTAGEKNIATGVFAPAGLPADMNKQLCFTRNSLVAWAMGGTAALVLGGCSLFGARHTDPVRVVTAEQLQGCRNVGSAQVSVIDQLPSLQQVDGAVARELVVLASNSALQLGGNAIVEMTNIVDGSQSFAVFRCP